MMFFQLLGASLAGARRPRRTVADGPNQRDRPGDAGRDDDPAPVQVQGHRAVLPGDVQVRGEVQSRVRAPFFRILIENGQNR